MKWKFNEFWEYDKSLKHKDPVSHMCLAGTVVACKRWQVAASNPYAVMTNISATEFNEFNENI